VTKEKPIEMAGGLLRTDLDMDSLVKLGLLGAVIRERVDQT